MAFQIYVKEVFVSIQGEGTTRRQKARRGANLRELEVWEGGNFGVSYVA